MKIAVTGATGFVGSRLLRLALAAGHEVRALTRRPQQDAEQLTWVGGALDQPESLAELVRGAEAVIHVAGVINAKDAAGFEAGNVEGTRTILAAAEAEGVKRFVHVSSLAAREPQLSMYGASKARSEELVRQSSLLWAIVRPPAVYGPGDKETLELFKMAKAGIVLLPPKGKLSLIHADDLGNLLLALTAADAPKSIVLEPDDGVPGGWSHQQLAQALAAAFDRKAITFSTPRALLHAGATIDRWLRGEKAKLTRDRAAYFSHPDWVADPALAAPKSLWAPAIDTREGLRATAESYRKDGLL